MKSALSSDQIDNLREFDLLSLAETIFNIELSQGLYKEKPVSIRQFYEDDYYLGASFNNVYRYWQEILDDIYPAPYYSPYYEVILSAAAGTGKTTLGTIGLLYDMYKLGCLADPRGYYNLDATTKIVFGLFSANLALAGDVNWSKICEALTTSPWFDQRMMDKRGLQKKSGSLNIVYVLDNIGIQIGSQFQHTMGKAIFGAILDEASFQQTKSEQAQKTYSELSNRMATRFTDDRTGSVPGHLWLASSPKDATDFLQRRIDIAKDLKGIKIVNNIAQWDVKPSLLGGGTFKVFIGNNSKDARILETDERIPAEEDKDVINVPNVFKDRFKKDLLISIMNLAGIRTTSTISLFRSVSLINDSMILDSPFTKNIIPLPFKQGAGEITDCMNMDYFKNIRHPECNRFIHLDAAYSHDRFGIAAVYCTSKEQSFHAHNDAEFLNSLDYQDKTFYVDFAIAIEAIKGQEIPLKKVETFIKYLIKVLGYPVALISADTFQSKRTLQEFENQHFNVQSTSVDRTRDPYLFYKDCINDRKIIQVKNELLKLELINLKDDGLKVDHPQSDAFGDSKDVSDAVCGALHNCNLSNNLYNRSKVVSEYTRGVTGASYDDIDLNDPNALEALEYLQMTQNKEFLNKFFKHM